MPALDLRELGAALRARDRAIELHLFDPNVTFIDVGFRILERQNRKLTRDVAVRVHLRHKPREEAFEAFAERDPERVIDERRVGFPVDIIEADYRFNKFWYSPEPLSPRAGVYDPLCGGISISNEYEYNYGTCGGMVEDRQTGNKMILSAWHVLIGSAYAPSDLGIYQPGYADGGGPQNTIARVTRHAMDKGIDAAVAELIGARPMVNDQVEIGPVLGVTTPTPLMRVTKSGRASRVTKGIITSILPGVKKIYYGGFERVIRNVFHIAQSPEGGELSRGGDSGSWWLEEDSKKAVGLHIAGADDPEYGLAISMPEVLDALDVDIEV